MRKQFWEVIYDDKNNKAEVWGPSSDDTLLTNNVAEMIRVEMKVHCQTADIDFSKEQIKEQIKRFGYEIDDNLYRHLINEFELLTGKHMKQW